MKWYAIMMIGVVAAFAAVGAVSEYAKYAAMGYCHATAIQAGKNPSEINQLCKLN